MGSIGIKSRPKPFLRIGKRNQLSQIRWTSSKVIPIEDLSWLHFDDEPRVQERQQVKDKRSCISVYITLPLIPLHLLCARHLQNWHRMELLYTPFMQTTQGNFPFFVNFPEFSLLTIIFVFLIFTLNPFDSNALFPQVFH